MTERTDLVTERIEQVKSKSHWDGTNNADREGTTAIVKK